MRLLCTVRACRAPLEKLGPSLLCPNRHIYDVARSGYVNLLQPQDRRSRNPGDMAEAVAARRRFFDAGHAEPLVRAIVEALPLAPNEALLDVGCGEGHHLAAFRRAYGVEAHGVDLSVAAIDLAARRDRDCTWIVANADRFIPYEDHSFDAVTSITSRLLPEEFHRVLKQGGKLLVAIAGADDLIELRRAERDRVERTVEMFVSHFALERHLHVRHVAHLDRDAIHDVMAASYRRKRIDDAMDVTFSRDVLLFRSRQVSSEVSSQWP
jgi:23S rRNA (guanine745-N1)-methyltransferase